MQIIVNYCWNNRIYKKLSFFGGPCVGIGLFFLFLSIPESHEEYFIPYLFMIFFLSLSMVHFFISYPITKILNKKIYIGETIKYLKFADPVFSLLGYKEIRTSTVERVDLYYNWAGNERQIAIKIIHSKGSFWFSTLHMKKDDILSIFNFFKDRGVKVDDYTKR